MFVISFNLYPSIRGSLRKGPKINFHVKCFGQGVDIFVLELHFSPLFVLSLVRCDALSCVDLVAGGEFSVF